MASQECKCTVLSIEDLTPTTFELRFDSEPGFVFLPGQFISIIIPGAGPNGRDLRRAYSIASTPEERPYRICVKLVEKGPGTNYLRRLEKGNVFKAYAPYGDFVYKDRPGKNICFISTGTGVSPFRSIIYSKLFKECPPVKAWCLFGTTTQDELLYDREMGAHPLVKWIPCLSRVPAGDSSWTGYKGRVTEYLRAKMNDMPWMETEFFLCGNGAMIDETKKFLLEKGVTPASIHQEAYYKPKPGE